MIELGAEFFRIAAYYQQSVGSLPDSEVNYGELHDSMDNTNNPKISGYYSIPETLELTNDFREKPQ